MNIQDDCLAKKDDNTAIVGAQRKSNKHLVICMVSDFLYPNVGGVEEHIFQLSQCLIQRGHKVVAITHVYGDRRGIRYMTNGLKVYYLPIQPFYNQSVLPTFLTSVPLLRDVFLRERVNIVHGHSAFSTMAHEAMSIASALGLKTVFTDHSLFGFADVSAIVTNNFLHVSLACVDHCICVSYVGKENTVLRASVPPHLVSVIPNALDTTVFRPRPYTGTPGRIVVVILCRLQYRKGVDLQPPIIRQVCAKYPQVDFVIGGGGPKQPLLSEVRDAVGPDRVRLLGPLPHAAVHRVLAKGHIFLNTSLTEAFCIAICEAVCSGLQVVSTDVGGICEVLPPHLILLARPTVKSLCAALEEAIERELSGQRVSPAVMHATMRSVYTWPDVAARTELVYRSVAGGDDGPSTVVERIRRYRSCGPVSGMFMAVLVALQAMLLLLCHYLRPPQNIDIAPDFPVPVTDQSDDIECSDAEVVSVTQRDSVSQTSKRSFRRTVTTATSGSEVFKESDKVFLKNKFTYDTGDSERRFSGTSSNISEGDDVNDDLIASPRRYELRRRRTMETKKFILG